VSKSKQPVVVATQTQEMDLENDADDESEEDDADGASKAAKSRLASIVPANYSIIEPKSSSVTCDYERLCKGPDGSLDPNRELWLFQVPAYVRAAWMLRALKFSLTVRCVQFQLKWLDGKQASIGAVAATGTESGSVSFKEDEIKLPAEAAHAHEHGDKRFGFVEGVEHRHLVNLFPSKRSDAYLLGMWR